MTRLPTVRALAVTCLTLAALITIDTPAFASTPHQASWTPPAPVLEPTVTKLNHASAHAAVGRELKLSGTNLNTVTGVLIENQPATSWQAISPTKLIVETGPAVNFQAAAAPITLLDATGRPVPVTQPFNYTVTNRVDREMAYAGLNWHNTKNKTYGFINNGDCANYVSQLLHARGWQATADWWNTYGSTKTRAAAWTGATSLSNWLKLNPQRATRLTWSQRSKVAVGDIVQFNWDWTQAEGDTWDHMAVVSKIVPLANGDEDIYYTAHTNPRLFGGSLRAIKAGYKHVRIKFWHLT